MEMFFIFSGGGSAGRYQSFRAQEEKEHHFVRLHLEGVQVVERYGNA